MAIDPHSYNYTTGTTQVNDIGVLSYNRCLFSPLFETKVSSIPVKDESKRTVKYIEHTISVDGFVTLPAGASSITSAMQTLYSLLTQQGGELIYQGRAYNINSTAGIGKAERNSDVAWGPVPELLEFQPLGAGRSAKVSWKVKTRLIPPAFNNAAEGTRLLQLNYDTSVTYDEAGYSSIVINGTTEIPMTRGKVTDREVKRTVDDFRSLLEIRIMSGIDFGRFRLTNRNFNVSRDKRTMEWSIAVAEKPYMDLPKQCTLAEGSYGVRPATTGKGLATWLCTLRATYTVAGGRARGYAYNAFMQLYKLRSQQSKLIPKEKNGGPPGKFLFDKITKNYIYGENDNLSERPWVTDFTVDEGMYLDSRTISFSVTWRIQCPWRHIVVGSGLWRRVPEGGRNQKKNLWFQSMVGTGNDTVLGSILGTKSWQANKLNPKLDIIVDMGSTEV